MHRAFTVIATTALLSIAASAHAAEGVLAVRPGDGVKGRLERCGDRHVLAIELVKGERFRARVRAVNDLSADVTVTVYDPTGLEIGPHARVRHIDNESVVGPFTANITGTYHLDLTTYALHGLEYETTTKVRRRGKRRMSVGGKRRTRRFLAAAGALVRIRGLREDATLRLGVPGAEAIEIGPGEACAVALRDAGLTAPSAGRYEISIPRGGGRARLVVTPPRRIAPGQVVVFPTLPADPESVAAWYDDAGWVTDPFLVAPDDHEALVSIPESQSPRPADPVSLRDAPTAPATPHTGAFLENGYVTGGVQSGVGMPMAPMPTMDDAVTRGRIEEFGDGPSYVYDVETEKFGRLNYRVSFVVGSGTSLAPLALDGRVAMAWSVRAEHGYHQGDWMLAFDALRGVEVLDGSERRIDASARVVQSVAHSFAMPVDGGAPSGELLWSLDSARDGSFTRRETYDGRGAVDLQIR